MSDLFSKVFMVVGLCLLAMIAFRPAVWPPDVYSGFYGQAAPAARHNRSGYRIVETEIDAGKIEEILAKNWNEGQWEMASAPIYTQGPNAKVILFLVQRW
ncbi:MAG TPA: hypothetical protein VN893_19405 [Bryobacteraceae bacterium]|jgi:hypothetical protein|nr:hypothetical protein [Bryobacteraceae bacterium]